MKGLGNDNQICYIQINEQRPSETIKHYEQTRNWLGNISRQEGFYSKDYLGNLTEFDNVMDGIYINQKTIIIKANIVIEFSHGRREIIYFNSDDEMRVFMKRHFQGEKWRGFN